MGDDSLIVGVAASKSKDDQSLGREACQPGSHCHSVPIQTHRPDRDRYGGGRNAKQPAPTRLRTLATTDNSNWAYGPWPTNRVALGIRIRRCNRSAKIRRING